MAIIDKSKRPLVNDRDELVNIGIDLPFHKGDTSGWFATTNYTIDAVKQNLKMLLMTQQGERVMQPKLGVNLRKFIFEPITVDTANAIENELIESINFWLPFLNIKDIKVSFTDDALGSHTIYVSVIFSLVKDPFTTESVQYGKFSFLLTQ